MEQVLECGLLGQILDRFLYVRRLDDLLRGLAGGVGDGVGDLRRAALDGRDDVVDRALLQALGIGPHAPHALREVLLDGGHLRHLLAEHRVHLALPVALQRRIDIVILAEPAQHRLGEHRDDAVGGGRRHPSRNGPRHPDAPPDGLRDVDEAARGQVLDLRGVRRWPLTHDAREVDALPTMLLAWPDAVRNDGLPAGDGLAADMGLAAERPSASDGDADVAGVVAGARPESTVTARIAAADAARASDAMAMRRVARIVCRMSSEAKAQVTSASSVG
eukprot:CAMPEP_0176079590 /NCGR_PEP_ID=MMETSP0120_2-20121206/39808_1 /TAXON_ID=160619 /ORGANISM="Kryptoperidinium foliaceum, Strain CCMP 1326" /LENGTH=275 /DNA_ID=CAMNT_0017413349 /DNA_START=168 /DNA_END=992 /DNA_ORIENTATION=+